MLLEVPNLLRPNGAALWKKIKMRARHFIIEAEVPMLLGIAFAALVAETGVLTSVATKVGPFLEMWLGLPGEASLGLLLGLIRRELAVLPLLELNLTTLQLFVGSVVALFYLPCLSVLAVLMKEFGTKVALLIGVGTTVGAFVIAGVINQVARLVISFL